MNFKRKGRSIINGDIIKPEIPYAEFSDDLIPEYMDKMILSLNHGFEMLMIYKEHKDNLHISNVVSMLERMENVYHQYERNLFMSKRKNEIKNL